MAALQRTGHPLEVARLNAGLTLEQVAARLVRTPTTVRRLELGVRKPTERVLFLLAELYGVPPGQLVP